MTQSKTDRTNVPVDEPLDPEVISFRAQFDQHSPLDEIVKEGARRMLQAAIVCGATRIQLRCGKTTRAQTPFYVMKSAPLPGGQFARG